MTKYLKKNPHVFPIFPTQDGLALRHASNELRNDWLFVASAVCRDGEALQFASNELRNDAKMVPLTGSPGQNMLGDGYNVGEMPQTRDLIWFYAMFIGFGF